MEGTEPSTRRVSISFISNLFGQLYCVRAPHRLQHRERCLRCAHDIEPITELATGHSQQSQDQRSYSGCAAHQAWARLIRVSAKARPSVDGVIRSLAGRGLVWIGLIFLSNPSRKSGCGFFGLSSFFLTFAFGRWVSTTLTWGFSSLVVHEQVLSMADETCPMHEKSHSWMFSRFNLEKSAEMDDKTVLCSAI